MACGVKEVGQHCSRFSMHNSMLESRVTVSIEKALPTADDARRFLDSVVFEEFKEWTDEEEEGGGGGTANVSVAE